MDIQQIIPKILEKFNFKELNAMQLAAIEAMKEHSELVLLSNTGSAKPSPFYWPCFHILMKTIATHRH
jgi:RIO-like serine/threonine protein kinase